MTRCSLVPGDPDYPVGLLDLAPPPALRVRGRLLGGPAAAVVGTREPSEDARAYARSLAEALARQGISVWSGGARGIDAAAHLGALDAGGHTVVVLGGGLSNPSPPANVSLFETVVESGGAIVSIFDDDAIPRTPGFLARNRVLAGGSDVLIVVECGYKSGARNAALHAVQVGRPLAVVLQAPWVGRGQGCYAEVELHGAIPLRDERHAIALVRRSRLARCLEPGIAIAPDKATMMRDEPPVADASITDPLEVAIVAAVRSGAADPDAVSAAVDKPASIVAAAVLELVLRGVLDQSHRGLALAPPRGRRQSPTS